MELQLVNKGLQQYLIIYEQGIAMDDYRIQMLLQYSGGQLLPMHILAQDESVHLQYEVNGYISLMNYAQNQRFDYKMIDRLFQAIWSCYEELEDYLLDIDGIVLDKAMIFYQIDRREFRLCYHLGNEISMQDSLIELIEFCMKYTNHNDTKAVQFIYGLYQMLQDGFTDILEIKSYIMDSGQGSSDSRNLLLKDTKYTRNDLNQTMQGFNPSEVSLGECENKSMMDKQSNQERGGSNYGWIYGIGTCIGALIGIIFLIRYLAITRIEWDIRGFLICMVVSMIMGYCWLNMRRKKRNSKQQQENVHVEEQFKEEYVRDMQVERMKSEPYLYSGETEVVYDASVFGEAEEWQLYRGYIDAQQMRSIWELKNVNIESESIYIKAFPAILGRNPMEANYVIEGSGISRKHARISFAESKLYIEDLHSTNGTFINDYRLKEEESVEVKIGDQIRIGPNVYELVREEMEE